VTVNAVAPGQSATDTFLSLQSEAEIQWINGQVIRANGGFLWSMTAQ
jgi:NAD(P)-dependent dehydrogenase (short-subunit alcohol dehydrogenase family)